MHTPQKDKFNSNLSAIIKSLIYSFGHDNTFNCKFDNNYLNNDKKYKAWF